MPQPTADGQSWVMITSLTLGQAGSARAHHEHWAQGWATYLLSAHGVASLCGSSAALLCPGTLWGLHLILTSPCLVPFPHSCWDQVTSLCGGWLCSQEPRGSKLVAKSMCWGGRDLWAGGLCVGWGSKPLALALYPQAFIYKPQTEK